MLFEEELDFILTDQLPESFLLEDIESKMGLFRKEYKTRFPDVAVNNPEEMERQIRKMIAIDPTEKKPYVVWVMDQVKQEQFILADQGDCDRVKAALSFFDKSKARREFKDAAVETMQELGKTLPPDQAANILKYSFSDLENIKDKLGGESVKSRREMLRQAAEKGSEYVYDDGTWAAIKIWEPEAAVKYAWNTRWCTSNAGTAAGYLNQGPLYVVLKKGPQGTYEKFGQLHYPSQQFKDIQDHEIRPIPEKVKEIFSKMKFSNAADAVGLAGILNQRLPQYEAMIEKDDTAATKYAGILLRIGDTKNVSNKLRSHMLEAVLSGYGRATGTIPDVEPEILRMTERRILSSNDKYKMDRYFEHVIGDKPDQVAEFKRSLIASGNPDMIIHFATSHMEGERWPEAEEVIKQKVASNTVGIAPLARLYAQKNVGGEWDIATEAVKKDPSEAVKYAQDVVKGEWKDGEPAIATDPSSSWIYSFFLQKRFPAGEAAIARDPEMAYQYGRAIIKPREHGWPDEVLKNAIEKAVLTDPKIAALFAIKVYQKRWPAAEDALAAFVKAGSSPGASKEEKEDAQSASRYIEKYKEALGGFGGEGGAE